LFMKSLYMLKARDMKLELRLCNGKIYAIYHDPDTEINYSAYPVDG